MPTSRPGELRMYKLAYYGLAVFYILAGVNHFIAPGFYHELIPEYLGNEHAITLISGVAEIALGMLVLFPRYRKLASRMIV